MPFFIWNTCMPYISKLWPDIGGAFPLIIFDKIGVLIPNEIYDKSLHKNIKNMLVLRENNNFSVFIISDIHYGHKINQTITLTSLIFMLLVLYILLLFAFFNWLWPLSIFCQI